MTSRQLSHVSSRCLALAKGCRMVDEPLDFGWIADCRLEDHAIRAGQRAYENEKKQPGTDYLFRL